ncbi:MAG: DUF6605 domain-containing protein [Geminicoccaceae bacterium]
MLKILGYADRFSVAPGETLRFMVSAYENQPYKASIVRLIHGDANPQGPGFKCQAVATIGAKQGHRQEIRTGSSVTVPDNPALQVTGSFTVAAMVWPTTPTKSRQGLIGHWDEAAEHGWLLEIDAHGCLAFRSGSGRAAVQVGTTRPMLARRWYLVAATFDAEDGEVTLVQRPLVPCAGIEDVAAMTFPCPLPGVPAGKPLVMGGIGQQGTAHLNGKIDAPRLLDGTVAPERLEALFLRPMPADLSSCIKGAWDFALAMETTRVEDTGPHLLHGSTHNLPTRAMKGWNWDGSEHCWWRAPDQYGAIHFHDDDLYDAGWEQSFAWTVPADLPSGVYAAHLDSGSAEDGTDEDYVPFFVRPPRTRSGRARPKLAFLAPTAAYMAYANDQNHIEAQNAEMVIGRVTVYQPTDVFLYDHPELAKSLYDSHSDGSGVAYSSRLRPITNMRPKYSSWLGASGSGLWQFNADTHVLDWMTTHVGEPFDVITDEDLHAEGLALLEPYACIVTGTHPEYHSTRMWDAMKAWIDKGGRLMYLAANGWYWRIAFSPDMPGVIEVRRAEDGIRTWEAEPGEYWHSFSREYGGLWRRQGRPPQILTGIGFMAQGFDTCSYYRRKPESYDPRFAWMWQGIEDELIGDFGLIGGGAAGLELDTVSWKLGTPPNTTVMASSENHSDLILLVNEEFGVVPPNLTGSQHPQVRADITFFDTAAGGAVFSTGSIAWCGSLSWNDYDNNVSRLTANVLRRFLDPAPFR